MPDQFHNLTCQEITEKIKTIQADFAIISEALAGRTKVAEALSAKERMTRSFLLIQLGEQLYLHIKETIISDEEIEKRINTLSVGGKSLQEIQQVFKELNIFVPSFTALLLAVRKEQKEGKIQKIKTIRLPVRSICTKDEMLSTVYTRTKEMGLKLCPAETGIYQRIKDIDGLRNPSPDYLVSVDSDHTSCLISRTKSNEPYLVYTKDDFEISETAEIIFQLPDRQ